MTPKTHKCAPPVVASSVTYPLQPDWTCGVCGRVWRDWLSGPLRYWAEAVSVLILCARVSWPVPAIRYGSFWRCSWCGARVKVVA